MTTPNANANCDDDSLRDRAQRLSRYARRTLAAEPALLEAADIRSAWTREAMQQHLAASPASTDTALMSSLRDLRKRVMVRLIARDLGGLASLAEVMTTMSALADVAIAVAVAHLERDLQQQYGEPASETDGRTQHLHVVGMGKLGGNELNVSSDIDLVFVYPEDGQTRGPQRISNHEFFIRMARRLIALLNELTGDGYVFRVDMRLRPLGSDGPLAVSFDMLENYFMTQGREWERYAWIKARTITGDCGTELANIVRPFVFRRHLDYSAFESMRALHREIREEVERRDILDNVKLGPGGIREVEFIVQLFQLVRGGHDVLLRQPSLVAIMPLLVERRLLPAQAADELMRAYEYLRNLEHRLQYLDDKQTQALPANDEDQALIAEAMNCPDYESMLAALNRHRAIVTRHFESIFAESAREDVNPLTAVWTGGDTEQAIAQLRALGYAQPRETLARIAALRDSSRIRQMPEASHARMAQLVPRVIAAAAKQSDADVTLERLLTLLESISRREAYLALLNQFPQTIERGAAIAAASPWAAQYLARYPILLDELLDTRLLYAPPEWPQLQEPLRARLDELADDSEAQMNALRHFKHAQTMHLLAQDLAGELALETLSDHLSALADLILAEVLRIVWSGLRTRHRDEPQFAVIAYGKLGGKELGYASDLDIIFLYEDAAAEAPENYARLAQRMNHWLTSMTSAGTLYETDLRLRPDGASGLLVSPVEGFAEYQHEHAWVWEHQALTRARAVAGNAAIGRQFEAIRAEVLRRPRELPALRKEIVDMRDKMLDAHPNTSGQFDIKHDRGGLIDVEFIVQYLVLGFAHAHAELLGNIGNLALLKLAGRLNLIEMNDALAAHDAYRRLRQLQHALRLKGDKYARVDRATLKTEIAAVNKLWNKVFETAA